MTENLHALLCECVRERVRRRQLRAHTNTSTSAGRLAWEGAEPSSPLARGGTDATLGIEHHTHLSMCFM